MELVCFETLVRIFCIEFNALPYFLMHTSSVVQAKQVDITLAFGFRKVCDLVIHETNMASSQEHSYFFIRQIILRNIFCNFGKQYFPV